jgi:hypothetical protein
MIIEKDKEVFEVIDKYTDIAGNRCWIVTNVEGKIQEITGSININQYKMYKGD